MASRGKFIVIDGGEGAGKGTQIAHLKTLYPDALFTREPGGSEYAEEIRNLMLTSPLAKGASAETQFGLAWASRADHIWRKILPALESGQNVFCDRFDSSTFAYQIYGQEGQVLEDLFFKTREIFLRDCAPDLYVFLEVNPKEGARRVAERKGITNHFDDRKAEFHDRVGRGYKKFQELFSDRVKVVDANPVFEEVRQNIVNIIAQALN